MRPTNSHFSETARLPLVIALVPRPINMCTKSTDAKCNEKDMNQVKQIIDNFKYILLPSSKVETSKMFTRLGW